MRRAAMRRWRALICCAVCMVLTAGIAGFAWRLSLREVPKEETSAPAPVVSMPVKEEEALRVDPVPVDGLDPELPIVALTVDDSVTALTEEYCTVLRENGCRATFFTVGYLAEEQGKLLRELIDCGMEIGNHSYSHQQLVGLSREKIWVQITENDRLLEELTGVAPELVRPPYGRVDGDVLGAAGHPVVLWSLDSQDARAESVQEIVDRLLLAKDGDIVRVHDGMTVTLEALRQGLPLLRDAGMQVTTVSDLFAVRGYGMENGKRYSRLPE